MRKHIIFKLGAVSTLTMIALAGAAFAGHQDPGNNDIVLPGVTQAQCPPPYTWADPHCYIQVPDTQTPGGFILLINTVTNWFVAAVVLIGVFYGVWGALEVITAGGDPTKTDKGKNKLFWALGGIFLAVIVRVIVTILVRFIGQV